MIDSIYTETKNLVIDIKQKKYNDIYIYFDSEIIDADKYRDIIKILSDAEEDDRVFIVLNTIGGLVSTTSQILNALIETKAKTKSIIHEASSGGSMLALYCDEVEVKQFGYMFIHAPSGGMPGKLNERLSMAEHLKSHYNRMFKEVYKGFLSEVLQKAFSNTVKLLESNVVVE